MSHTQLKKKDKRIEFVKYIGKFQCSFGRSKCTFVIDQHRRINEIFPVATDISVYSFSKERSLATSLHGKMRKRYTKT